MLTRRTRLLIAPVLIAVSMTSNLPARAFNSAMTSSLNPGHKEITGYAARLLGMSPELTSRLKRASARPDSEDLRLRPFREILWKVAYPGLNTALQHPVLTVASCYEASNLYRPEHHFDRPRTNGVWTSSRSAFSGGLEFVGEQQAITEDAIRQHNYAGAAVSAGRALHALQDFCSHSNFIDLKGKDLSDTWASLSNYAAVGALEGLRLTSYDTEGADTGDAASDPEDYTHDARCKDGPLRPESKLPYSVAQSKFDAAIGSARLLSVQFFMKVRNGVSDSLLWEAFIHDDFSNQAPPVTGTGVMSGDAENAWECMAACPGGHGTVSCHGTTASCDAGSLDPVRGEITLSNVSLDQMETLSDLVTADGFVTCLWRHLEANACTDTNICALSGTMHIAFSDSDLAGISSSELHMYQLGDPDSGWVRIPNATVNLNTHLATFDFQHTGTFALAGLPFGHGQMSVKPWNWYQDAFPTNSEGYPPLGSSSFDTTTAVVRTGLNAAPPSWNATNPDFPGDSIVVRAPGDSVRVDLVFRILPGPGNYAAAPAPRLYPPTAAMRLLRVPTNPSAVVDLPPAAGDHSFWAEFIRSPGQFSAGNHHFNQWWDPNTWNSVRCDTAEFNRFPVSALGITTPPELGVWMSTIHELDPKFTTLGVLRPRCFLIDTSGIISGWNCGEGSPYPPAWTADPATGFNPVEVPGQPGLTREGTQILPDGLFTPGTHVEYFFRKQNMLTGKVWLLPDTLRAYPQYDELSLDAHRWQQWNVLPDRWKDPWFGNEVQCRMLVIDYADGLGDETAWLSIADSIGATRPNRFGAGVGWHATQDQSVNDSVAFTSANRGQPGTTWDLYQVRGGSFPTGYPLPAGLTSASGPRTVAAGTIGSRLAPSASGAASGKDSRQGPSQDMMNRAYRLVLLLSGEVSDGILGPYRSRSQNDVQLLENWLTNPFEPRGLWVMGSGFAESNAYAWGPAQLPFMGGRLGTLLADADYAYLASDPSSCLGLYPALALSPADNRCSVRSGLDGTNDVLVANTNVLGTALASHYGVVESSPGPFGSGVLKTRTPAEPWVSLVDGFDIQSLSSVGCADTRARNLYFLDVFQNVFGEVYQAALNSWPLDAPKSPAVPLRPFLRLRNTPVTAGPADVWFGLPSAGFVSIRIFDVAGRRVRTLVDGVLAAGEHHASWDGRAVDGAPRRPGVYFLSYAAPGLESGRKLIVLR